MKWLKVPITLLKRIVIKMNNKGFTLMELLAVLVIIGVVFGITFYILRGTMATSLTQMDEAVNNQIYEAAKSYVIETNQQFNRSGYACVSLQELIDSGYVSNVDNPQQIIKITRNLETKVIEEIKYVEKCN